MRAASTTKRRRPRAVPWVLLGLWVAVLALASPFAGKLGDVQRDRAVDYLPASADSTQVAEVQEQLPGGESTELVLVYHRDSGLSAADRKVAADQVSAVAREFKLVATPTGVASKDGTTLMYPVASTAPGTDEEKRDTFVNDVRDVVKAPGGPGDTDGLKVDVGGSGALATDASEVYSSLDGPLLYTTVGVVAILLILIYRSPLLWLVPLAVAGVANYLSMGVAYGLNQAFDTSVSGQSSGIMTILVFGAGTDYALLIVSATARNCAGSSGRTTPCAPPCAAAGPPSSPPPARSPRACSACSPPTSTAAGAWGRWVPSVSCARSSPC